MKVHRVLTVVILAAAGILAASPIGDYADRLHRAASIMSSLFEDGRDEPPDEEIAAALESAKRLVPAKDEVVLGNEKIRVDNSALTDAIERLRRRYRSGEGSGDERYDELVELAGRVVLLADRVGAAVEPATVQSQDQHAQLASILSRPEYQPELRQESRLRKWINRAWAAFIRLLDRLFASQADPRPTPGRASLDVIRILITLGLVIALGMGSYYLAKRLRKRRRTRAGLEEKTDVREVLGEEISADMTSQDLLAMAAALARQGDYRSAIRRAFIALLFELEGRGKVRLDRAKTNRDYINEVRPDPILREPVAVMTSVFERVWYGQRGASREDYSDFLRSWPRE